MFPKSKIGRITADFKLKRLKVIKTKDFTDVYKEIYNCTCSNSKKQSSNRTRQEKSFQDLSPIGHVSTGVQYTTTPLEYKMVEITALIVRITIIKQLLWALLNKRMEQIPSIGNNTSILSMDIVYPISYKLDCDMSKQIAFLVKILNKQINE